MSTTALQLAHASAPLIQDYRSLLARVNAQRPQSEECPEVEDPSVSVVEQLAAQIVIEPAVVPAVPTHLTTRLTNALSCSIPTLQAQQELVDSCRAEAKLAEKLGYAWRSREDTTTRGEKGLRIDSDEVSLLAWFAYGGDTEGPARAQASVRRMLACVRACEGIDTELLEMLDPGELDAAVNDPHRDASHPMLSR